MIRYLGFSAFQNVTDQPAGTVPIRNIKKNELYYESKKHPNDNISQILKDNASKSEGLSVGIQITGSPYKDEQVLRVMKEI